MDYRKLNEVTVKDKFPIPIINDLLHDLKRANMFSKINLKADYHQIRMKEKDIPKIIVKTHQGYFEFKFMSFDVNQYSCHLLSLNELSFDFTNTLATF